MTELHLNTNVHPDFILDFRQNKEKSWIYGIGYINGVASYDYMKQVTRGYLPE